jgi:sigma54-dependent transcription regulator
MVNPSGNKDKEGFLYPRGKYYGKFTPQHLTFNANLQEFAQRVSYLCGLESSGKITTEKAFEGIKSLWEQLEASKKALLDDFPESQAEE